MSRSIIKQFEEEVSENIAKLGKDNQLSKISNEWLVRTAENKYSYNFKAFGRPIIQYPQDMIAMHEIIWNAQPDLIIETGIAHGGSLIWYAGLLEVNASCGGPKDARILGIDIDIRSHNREAIENHPLASRVEMIQGSSIDQGTIDKVLKFAEGYKNVMVILDSNHTHQHVLEELEAYAHLTTIGNYCVVFDTVVEDMPAGSFPDRPWDIGDNPKTAVWEFVKNNPNFAIDHGIDAKIQVSVAPSGYLKRIS